MVWIDITEWLVQTLEKKNTAKSTSFIIAYRPCTISILKLWPFVSTHNELMWYFYLQGSGSVSFRFCEKYGLPNSLLALTHKLSHIPIPEMPDSIKFKCTLKTAGMQPYLNPMLQAEDQNRWTSVACVAAGPRTRLNWASATQARNSVTFKVTVNPLLSPPSLISPPFLEEES